MADSAISNPQSKEHSDLTHSEFRKTFENRWTAALRKPNSDDAMSVNALWEGSYACAELCEKGLLAFIQPNSTTWKSQLLLDQIIQRSKAYRMWANQVVRRNYEYRDLDKFLDDRDRQFRNQLKGVKSEFAKRLLSRYRDMFSADRARLEKDRAEFCVRFRPWVLDSYVLKYKSAPVKEEDADSLFQIEIAVVFLHHLNDVSLRTIARLVVLTYIAAGLIDGHGKLILRNGDLKLALSGIEKRLRRAHVHRHLPGYKKRKLIAMSRRKNIQRAKTAERKSQLATSSKPPN